MMCLKTLTEIVVVGTGTITVSQRSTMREGASMTVIQVWAIIQSKKVLKEELSTMMSEDLTRSIGTAIWSQVLKEDRLMTSGGDAKRGMQIIIIETPDMSRRSREIKSMAGGRRLMKTAGTDIVTTGENEWMH